MQVAFAILRAFVACRHAYVLQVHTRLQVELRGGTALIIVVRHYTMPCKQLLLSCIIRHVQAL